MTARKSKTPMTSIFRAMARGETAFVARGLRDVAPRAAKFFGAGGYSCRSCDGGTEVTRLKRRRPVRATGPQR